MPRFCIGMLADAAGLVDVLPLLLCGLVALACVPRRKADLPLCGDARLQLATSLEFDASARVSLPTATPTIAAPRMKVPGLRLAYRFTSVSTEAGSRSPSQLAATRVRREMGGDSCPLVCPQMRCTGIGSSASPLRKSADGAKKVLPVVAREKSRSRS